MSLLAYKYRWTSPTLGRAVLVLGEMVLVIVLCFYKLDPSNQWQWEDIGYRTGFIASAQLPLVILLAGKNNIIGFLTGVSYEKLNWLHRWVSRILFLNATIHMGFWFTDWARYDYIKVKLRTDVITQRGFAAWCILFWIVLSSMAPIRRWNYEFFVVQHIVTSVGFLVAVFLHLPAEVKMYVWIAIGLVIFDRFIRTLYGVYSNLSIFHPDKSRNGIWTCQATFQPLGSDATRIKINNPPIQWKAGQHVFLSCHGISPLQSHPFTIASLPEDGQMEFLAKRRRGATNRFFVHAEKYQNLPLKLVKAPLNPMISVLIDGPYGRIRPLQQFDSICFIAGGIGSTLTMPLMRDIVARWKGDTLRGWNKPAGAATRSIQYIWIIRSREQYSWFATQLRGVAEDVEHLRTTDRDVAVEMSVYITCDTTLTEDQRRATIRSSDECHQMSALGSEKAQEPAATVETMSADRTGQQNFAFQTCLERKTCCCTKVIEDEAFEANSSPKRECSCNDPQPELAASTGLAYSADSSSDRSTKSTSPLASTAKPLHTSDVHPSINVLTGRPHPKNLIRKSLEHALGESAVVVCGPQSLIHDVRQNVVILSDERAVHKGTGAQGVYLHVEVYDY